MDVVGHEAEDGYFEPAVLGCTQELAEDERNSGLIYKVRLTVICRECKEISELSEIVEVPEMLRTARIHGQRSASGDPRRP
jgi:hypothetical protein